MYSSYRFGNQLTISSSIYASITLYEYWVNIYSNAASLTSLDNKTEKIINNYVVRQTTRFG